MAGQVATSLSPLSIRGVNYYPLDFAWCNKAEPDDHKWPRGVWGAPDSVWQRDMKVVASLNVNTVRVFIEAWLSPPSDGSPPCGPTFGTTYDPHYLQRFDDFLGIADQCGIRVIACNFYHPNEVVQTLIEPHKNDPRILMWEVRNECISVDPNVPDSTRRAEATDCAARMNFIKRGRHAIDTSHLITSSVQHGWGTWLLRSDATDTLGDAVGDVYSFHYSGDLLSLTQTDLQSRIFLEARTQVPNKMIVWGEYGCSTKAELDGHPGVLDPRYSEDTQYQILFQSLQACEEYKETCAGALCWQMFDLPPHVINQLPPPLALGEKNYGILRTDYSLKPAARLIRDAYYRWSIGVSMTSLIYKLPTLSFGNAKVISYWIALGDLFSGALQTISIVGFPDQTLAVSASVTEADPVPQADGGLPKIGNARFFTKSVQFFRHDGSCRIVFQHDSPTRLYAGVMLTIGAG